MYCALFALDPHFSVFFYILQFNVQGIGKAEMRSVFGPLKSLIVHSASLCSSSLQFLPVSPVTQWH